MEVKAEAPVVTPEVKAEQPLAAVLAAVKESKAETPVEEPEVKAEEATKDSEATAETTEK